MLLKRCLVQIYEVQRPEEAEALVEIGVDHIGSVLLSGENWKQPSIKAVVETTRKAGRKSSLIPLFTSSDQVARALDFYQPNMVHFCEALVSYQGQEAQWAKAFDLQRVVKERFPEIKMMRSIPIAPPGCNGSIPSLSLARQFEAISDYFLTDTLLVKEDNSAAGMPQPVSGFVGITGKICDWDVAAHLVAQSKIPVILAGGISPDNALDGLRRVNPAGVDSCTCTNAVNAEGEPIRFQKNLDQVRKLVANVRRHERTRDATRND
ncbi:MAG: hypothetical protein RBT11_13385 [Desulfobacterales bacterium]|jgi:phosphoribosylanthranilate isomerase|nr:hypothetical protein [Desulfobacterales bacterium]